MTTAIGELELDDAAKRAAGNWRQFNCFVWHRAADLSDPDEWAVLYSHHRDSGLLDQSNAAAIGKALEPFTDGDDPDVVAERHSHFACGWIDGFSVRVFRDGQITDAFRRYHDLAQRIADYLCLDESDYSQREYDATLANIADAAWRLRHVYDLPDEGWEAEVFSWLLDNDERAVSNVDDQGGYPPEDSLKAAFAALGYARAA
jgi:hypothetical protein